MSAPNSFALSKSVDVIMIFKIIKGRSVVRPKSINNIIYDFLKRYIVVYIVNLGFLCNDFVIEVHSN